MTKFKIGDRVRVSRNRLDSDPGSCVGLSYGIGETATIQWVSPSEGGHVSLTFDDLSERGCYHPNQLTLLRGRGAPVLARLPKFLLRYELESDPVEEFATLPEVKTRVKELLTKPDLKRHSIKVYEIARVIDVKVSEQITFSTAKQERAPKKKSKIAA